MAQIGDREANVRSLAQEFPRYLRVFERQPPFNRYGQREYHVETIQRRREAGSAANAIDDEQFLTALYKTLRAWGIGVRASKLCTFEEFVIFIRARRSEIIALENKTIDDPELDANATARQLWSLINTLGIVANNTPIVAGTKALHHILPDLMVPMDRAYTQRFFCWHSPTFQYEQRSCFEEAFVTFAMIARKTNPEQYVANGGWHSSRTKVIDNALIGLIFDQQSAAEQRNPPKAKKPKGQNFERRRSTESTQTSFWMLIQSFLRWCRRALIK
jgi:hypothetical protein